MSLVGRQIGRYKILEQLGQGGMSIVYKAFDTTLDREVAVKVLHPHLATKPESRKRLEREAKAVARLHHPNILEVFDFSGAESPEAYIVTEYIRGKTLRQFITDESMQPPEIAAMVMHELASALAHAHDAGVLHRDLKPENVMLREDGVVKLTDFGIAKLIDRDEKMTVTGALVGSPAHMAPEIIEGEESGAEADVFSLGTMLYLFATGKLPFVASNTTATLKRILDCVYDDPRQIVPSVSDELADIIGTCLQRDPALRYPNAGKLRDALAQLLTDLGITRPHEELPRFFMDPKGYRKELVPRVTGALLKRAEALLAEKKTARAMAALNQVLAHEPSNARANELLAQMKARRVRDQRQKQLTRVALAVGALFIVAMGTFKGVQVATRAPDLQVPLSFGPADVVLANVQWPRAPEPTVEAPDAGVVELPVDAGTAELVTKVVPFVRPRLTPVPVAVEKKNTVEVKVLVRPFGYLTVDQGRRSESQNAMFTLSLTPGEHAFTVNCDFCTAAGATRRVSVSDRGEQTVNLIAPLRPSLVTFDGYPAEAVVTVGAQQRTVAEASKTPFTVSMPPEGSTQMRHQVHYEVALDGKLIDSGNRAIEPGQQAVISRGGKGP